MTDVGLKEYFERRLEDLDKRLMDRFHLGDMAISKAERTMAARLDSMNEFRDALRDQANRMATRVEVEKLEEQLQELRRAKANLDGRLFVMSGLVSISVSVVLWGLARLFP